VVALALAIVAVELVGASGSVFTVRGLDVWYDTLRKPPAAPPNWVFGPVWTTLFALLGAALWFVWRRAGSSPGEVRLGFGVFVLQFVFNVGWSAVFFGMREIGWALVVLGVLWLLVVATMWAFARVDRRAALLLVPYLLWVSFAAYLNYRFWALN
jgi:tryptophan-rich sensory protein